MKPIPVVFHIWKLQIHTYGIGLAITFWFAFRYFERRLRSRGYPYQWLTGAFVWIIVAAVIGARVMHVIPNWSDYSGDPIQVFAIWNGGLSSFGGIIFAIPTGLYQVHKHCPSLAKSTAMDMIAPVLMAAWGLGRLLGPQLMVRGGGHPTTQWFGMYYADQVGKRLPVPIFQSIESFCLFGIVLLVERRILRIGKPRGFVTATTASLWGLGRFFEEHLWLSYPGHLGSELVQGAGLALFVAGAATAFALWRHRDQLPIAPGPNLHERGEHEGSDEHEDVLAGATTSDARPAPVGVAAVANGAPTFGSPAGTGGTGPSGAGTSSLDEGPAHGGPETAPA